MMDELCYIVATKHSGSLKVRWPPCLLALLSSRPRHTTWKGPAHASSHLVLLFAWPSGVVQLCLHSGLLSCPSAVPASAG